MEAEAKKDGKEASPEKFTSAKILIFRASDEFFALPLTDISSIGEEVNAAGLPQMPGFIEGILTVRGEMIPAVHLAKRLQLEILEKTDKTRHIIIKREQGQLALIVDELIEIMRFESKKLQAVPEYLQQTAHAPYITGIFESAKGVTSILDLKILFSKAQIDQLSSFEKISEFHKRKRGSVETEAQIHKKEKIEQIKTLIKAQLAPGQKDKPAANESEADKPKDEVSHEEKKDLKKTGS
jgi:purine-binding chemotaxis protein CheW